ncbi:MAG: carboxypeptidase regulatory-like domain-containing protein [Ignavibacteria bacterium]|nr:carboxypeptidase regulatory-like domain-containing protein [Ignavibacteria bacterium]
MKKYLPLNIYFRNLFYKKILLVSIRFFFVLSTFFYLIFVTGCNKTGLKGTAIYGPTNSPIEGIEISAIPNLNTEERSSLTKSGTSDKNGEYKISGLETQYTYDLIVKNNKYKDVIDRKSLPNRIRAEVKDQTTLVKPIVLIDLLPGKKNYVKRQDGKFEELTPVPVSFIRTIKLTDRYNSTARCVNIDQIITLNPIKIKNGDIIFVVIRECCNF